MNFGFGRMGRRLVGGLAASVLGVAFMGASLAHAGEVRFQGEGHAQNPTWSLDGSYVAFEVNRFAGDIDLFASEVNGGIAKDASKISLPGGSNPFGKTGQVVVNPVWHPQGIMVFEGSNQGGRFRLYYVSPGGAAAAEMLPNNRAPGDLTFPTISSDGNLMAYVSDETGNGDVRLWDRTTDKISHVTRTTGSEMFPQFSADGTKMVFTRKRNDVEAVYVVDIATGQETVLSSGNGDRTRPVFAGSSDVVFFTNERGQEKWDIVAVDTSGGNRRVLAKEVRLPHRARPATSPDGKWVAFAYDDPSKGDSVFLMPVAGGSAVEITTEFKACGEPALTLKDGRMVLAYTALPSTDSDWRFLRVADITDKL